MDCSLPGFSVHGILQARILEWGANPFSREYSWPRDQIHVSYVSFFGRWILTTSATWDTEIRVINFSYFQGYILYLDTVFYTSKKKNHKQTKKDKKVQQHSSSSTKEFYLEFQPWNLFFKQERHTIYCKKHNIWTFKFAKLNIDKHNILQKDLWYGLLSTKCLSTWHWYIC